MSCTMDLDQPHTIDELLQGCIRAFDAQGKVRDPHLVRLVLVTHAWYLPPAQLAARLLRTVQDSGGSAEGPSLRLKISHFVRYWLRAFPHEVAADPELVATLRGLREALGPETPPIDLESLPAPGSDEEDSGGDEEASGVPPGAAPPRRKAALLLDRLPPPALAALITRLELRALSRVRLQDLVSFSRAGAAVSPALRRVVSQANAIARWVQLLVLSPPSAPQRAQALQRCLQLAKCLLELRNFQSLQAVVGGLGHGAIARLRQTLALLPPDCAKLWGLLAETLSSGGNFGRYRGLLGAGGLRLPALGVHLRDLAALEEALPEWGGPGRPHPKKLQRRFAVVGAILGGGEQGPPVSCDPALLRLLTVTLDLGQSEDQLYRLSLEREPRERTSGPPPALPPPCPVDQWALPEPPPPDPAVLREHLERLVESIFRHYDVDGDGRISRAEFGIVRQNFPHLRLFGDLDTDRDGGLSPPEVLAEFLRCSRVPPPPPPAPQHRLQPRGGRRPTACDACARPIWGLRERGLKCSGCGLRCHPECRDSLRPDCRRRTQSVAAEGPPKPAGPPQRAFSLALPPPGAPQELQEVEDAVFDVRL
ncbi:LOW QUALITY PROTEIN: RAS guanyl-releasing protein 2-like [Phaenicophaeus curvirostris]|uniref:LOW QUALITY PROTEIN: RAS guanyl-releasing protein 2-like n=1 Tax=Phaenicophaeus curvirostris TaxID=33595 RepID=UPI0037F0D381